MKKALKIVAVVLAVVTCISMGGCVTTDTWAFKLGNESMSAGIYAYQLRQQMSSYLTQNSLSASDETWDAEHSDKLTVGEYLQTTTVQNLVAALTWRAQFEKLELSFTEEEQATIQENIDRMIEASGGEKAVKETLKQQGIHYDEFFDVVFYDTQKILKVINYYFGQEGLEPVPEKDILAYFKDNYARTKHILISTVDSDGATMIGEEMQKARKQAQSVYEQAKNADEATFEKLIKKYNSDEGVAAYPDGYVFTSGEMVDEFEKAAFDMEVGETRLVQSAYGFHIIRKLTLEDENIFTEEIRQKMLMNIKGKEIAELFAQWQEEMPCKINKSVLRKYTCKSVKMGEETSQGEEDQMQALADQLGLEKTEE